MSERCQGWLPGGKSRCTNPATKIVRRKFSKHKKYLCVRCLELISKNASPADPLRISDLVGPAL